MTTSIRFWTIILVLSGAAIVLHLLSHGEDVPIQKPLAMFPMSFDNWQGREAPLERRIIEAVGVTDYLSRTYEAHGSLPVLVYVGYYRSQRTGQLAHSPKNCLPGAGWEPVSSAIAFLNFPDGRRVSVNKYVVEHGLQRQLVLYWYQSHGRVVASEYWGKIYLVLDALRLNRTDTALIRISTPIGTNEAASNQYALAFAQGFLSRSESFLPN